MKKNKKIIIAIGISIVCIVILIYLIIILNLKLNKTENKDNRDNILTNNTSNGESNGTKTEEEIDYNNSDYIFEHEQENANIQYNEAQLNNFEFNVIDIPNECVEVINEIDVYKNAIKEYVYLNGLVDADTAKYEFYNYNDEQKILDIIFEINNQNKTTLLVALYLDTGELEFKEYE